MKNSLWFSPKRIGFLGLAVLATAGVGILAGGPAESAITATCAKVCVTESELVGVGTFGGTMTGSVTAAPGKAFVAKSGLRTTPLNILGSSMRGNMEGVGEVMMWLDKSRPVAGSELRENKAGSGFPATQMMKSHLLMTIESEPGRTFRTLNPFVVGSNEVTSFPPQGVMYRLASQVEFEDVDQPGEVAVRILKGQVTINPVSRLYPRQPSRTSPREEETGR